MPRKVIVELEPNETLAVTAATAPSSLFGFRSNTASRAAFTAEAMNVAAVPAGAGFTLDTSFPPVPIPQVNSTRRDGGTLATRTLASAFDVRPRLNINTNLREVPYIVRGEIDDDAQAEALTAQPNVRAVYSDPVISPCPVCPGSPAVGTDRDVARVLGVDKLAAAGMDGRGVLVAIVDTGINLQYLQSRGKNPNVDAQRSWISATSTTKPFEFGVDHGTMCAYDVMIAAPQATLLDMAVLHSPASPQPGESPMSGLLSDAVLAYSSLLTLLRAPNTRPGATFSLVVSNSWAIFDPAWDFPANDPGNYTDNMQHPFNRIVATMESFGADILFAAGNCGAECPDGRCAWPAGVSTIAGANSHPAVLCVAGVDVTGERAGYSSIGPGHLTDHKPDLSGFTHFTGSGVYPTDGGTSAACPVVAGVVAAVRSRLPVSSGADNATPSAVRDMFRKTALEHGNPGYDYAYGWGIVNGSRLSEVVPGISPVARPDTVAAISRLASAMRGAPSLAADVSGKKKITAHVVTGENIKSVIMTTVEDDVVFFSGSDTDRTAEVTTNDAGDLNWSLVLSTEVPDASWKLMLTKKGEKEGDPVDQGLTDSNGDANPHNITHF